MQALDTAPAGVGLLDVSARAGERVARSAGHLVKDRDAEVVPRLIGGAKLRESDEVMLRRWKMLSPVRDRDKPHCPMTSS